MGGDKGATSGEGGDKGATSEEVGRTKVTSREAGTRWTPCDSGKLRQLRLHPWLWAGCRWWHGGGDTCGVSPVSLCR